MKTKTASQTKPSPSPASLAMAPRVWSITWARPLGRRRSWRTSTSKIAMVTISPMALPRSTCRSRLGGEECSFASERADGWWYLLAGKHGPGRQSVCHAQIFSHHQTRSWRWMRIRPDMKPLRSLTDGLRNAYDFALRSHGRACHVRSDDERDISLPWYRPTRVLELTPTFHMGWESNSWKRPDDWWIRHECSPQQPWVPDWCFLLSARRIWRIMA